MSRKDKAKKTVKAPVAEGPLFSSGGKKLIGAGVGLIALGFVFLSLTDPMGRNWASVCAPFSILTGYAVVFLGIFWPLGGGEEPASASSSLPPVRP